MRDKLLKVAVFFVLMFAFIGALTVSHNLYIEIMEVQGKFEALTEHSEYGEVQNGN